LPDLIGNCCAAILRLALLAYSYKRSRSKLVEGISFGFHFKFRKQSYDHGNNCGLQKSSRVVNKSKILPKTNFQFFGTAIFE